MAEKKQERASTQSTIMDEIQRLLEEADPPPFVPISHVEERNGRESLGVANDYLRRLVTAYAAKSAELEAVIEQANALVSELLGPIRDGLQYGPSKALAVCETALGFGTEENKSKVEALRGLDSGIRELKPLVDTIAALFGAEMQRRFSSPYVVGFVALCRDWHFVSAEGVQQEVPARPSHSETGMPRLASVHAGKLN